MTPRRFLVVAAIVIGGFTVQGQGQEDLGARYYANGLNFLSQKRYADAVLDLEKVVNSYPNSPAADDALLALAKYHLEVEADTAAAQKAADTLIEKYASSDSAPAGYVVSGRILLATTRAKDQMDVALGRFERVSGLYPNTPAVPEALFYAGETFRLTNRTAEAISRLRQVALDYPRSIWAAKANLSVALCSVTDGQPAAAMSALQQVRLRFPGTPEAATALLWNTQLYRLYLRPQTEQPAYAFTRTVTGPTGKLKDVNSLVVDADGVLFASTRNQLNVFTADGHSVPQPNIFQPRGVFTDRLGRAVILQRASVQPAGATPVVLSATKPDGSPRVLDEPLAAAAWQTGEYLVADGSTRTILKFSAQGKALGTLAPARATRLAVNDRDELAYLSRDDKQLAVIGRDGKTIRQIPWRAATYELREPADIAFDGVGHLFVLDPGRLSLMIFNPAGALVAALTIPEKSPGSLKSATALAVDRSGRVYIYDESTERVQIYE